MSEILIKTWSCAECGYRQDCEPTKANADFHFNKDRMFPIVDLAAGECPACALKGVRGKKLARETDPAKKCRMNFLDESEHAALIAALEAEGPQQVSDGVETRDETVEEKGRRVEKEIAKLEGLSVSEKAKARADLLAQPARKVDTHKMRDELPHERKARIDHVKIELKPMTAAEIKALRDKYED